MWVFHRLACQLNPYRCTSAPGGLHSKAMLVPAIKGELNDNSTHPRITLNENLSRLRLQDASMEVSNVCQCNAALLQRTSELIKS